MRAEKPRRKPISAPDIPTIGRPPELSGGKRVNVYLDASTLERARKIGGGNLSEGLRIAVERAG